MPRFTLSMILLASLLGFAGSAAAQPFMLVYASDSACDLSSTPPQDYQATPSSQPVLPPYILAVGQNATLDLCYLNWPVADSAGSEVVCTDGSGTESCAEQALFVTNGGIEVTGFTPVGADPEEDFPKYQARFDATNLKVAGGHPITGRQGNGLQGLLWGTVTLHGAGPAGTFEITNAGGWVDSSMETQNFPVALIATTINNCGNSVLDPGEECEDGNQVLGDGCAPNCRIESDIKLTGSVGPPGTTGSLDVEIDGVPVTLNLAVFPNAPAEEIILALVSNVNGEAALAAEAGQFDDSGQDPTANGRRFTTDGQITSGPDIFATAGDLQQVPEPGQIAMLVAGVGLLGALSRRRFRSHSQA